MTLGESKSSTHTHTPHPLGGESGSDRGGERPIPINANDLIYAWRGDPADLIDRLDDPPPPHPLPAYLALVPAWTSHAACIGSPGELFFPARGEPSKPALEVCGGCPVRQQCLDEALADAALDHGIRGGM